MKKLKVPICSDFQSEQLDIFIVFVGAIFSEKKGGPFYCRGPIYCRRVYTCNTKISGAESKFCV